MSATPRYVIPPPTVHLGGNSREALLAEYRRAANALYAAIRALPCPHGRDYYLTGDEVNPGGAARAAVRAMARDLEAMAESLGEVYAVILNGKVTP